MKISLKLVLRLTVFFLLIISCFQAVLILFPLEQCKIFCPTRLIAGFVMCSVVMFHNFTFNRYIKVLKKRSSYFSIAALLLLLSWGIYVLLSLRITTNTLSSETILMSLGVVIFFMLAGLIMNEIYFFLTKQSNYLENQVIMKQLELDHLKNQLNPHFLFNSLNNVAATMQVDTELALNYIYTLSSLLRYQVESSDKEFVTLAEENFFIESFLGIEEVRLGDRCEISFESNISGPGEKLPPLLIQPFVERAIKQSSCLTSKAIIKIVLQEKDRELFLNIKGSVPLTVANKQTNGIGIENAKKRLELFYPSAHKVITTQIDGFIETSLFIDLTSFKRIS
jgi:sensor histidine kinase YesM